MEFGDEVMKKCYECGKELKFWQGYYHPTLGKTEFVCSECFDILEESLEKYRNFILKELKQGREIKINNNSTIKLRHMVH
jgi:hypothetical protein